MSNIIKQTALLTYSGLCSLPERQGTTLVTIVSVAAVVGVLISLLAIREGTSIFQPGRPDEVVVLSRGASNIAQSALSREAVTAIEEAPGIERTLDGRPYAYAFTVVSVDALRRDGKRGAVNLAGYQEGWEKAGIDIVAGRPYRPGLRELLVSEAVRTMFRGLDVGNRITLHGAEWTVVGVFTSNDSQSESLLRADAETVMSAFGRNTYGQVTLRLESPDTYQRFAESLRQNPALSVEVMTAREQFERSFGPMRRLLTFVSWFIGGLMASGAAFGALNSLYASVESREREIATVRALGFHGIPVMTSVLVESLLLALPGALLGAFVAWHLFNGNFVNSGSLLFRLSVTPYLLALGVAWGLAIGLVGGSLPALRAARLPVAEALRAS
jgi:putative ABC transport system permease protein